MARFHWQFSQGGRLTDSYSSPTREGALKKLKAFVTGPPEHRDFMCRLAWTLWSTYPDDSSTSPIVKSVQGGAYGFWVA